jgi:predicted RNA-binding protein YlxR (DUF448 family)
MKPKTELVRVVRSPEGDLSMDLTGRKAGRGAYVCHNIECLRIARKRKALERSFACAIPSEIYDRLEQEMMEGE